MTKEVYIGNLPFQTTEEQVRRLCTPFGAVKAVAMIADRDTRRFRGFCFVEMADAAATAAAKALDGKEVSGRKIRASIARPRKKEYGSRKRSDRSDDRPLHERTQRGGYGAHEDGLSDSGGSRSGRGWSPREQRGRDSGNRDFPDSGGGSRRNS